MTVGLPSPTHCAQSLAELLRRCEGITAAMLALRDGRPYAEKSRLAVESGKFAAMASSLVALGHGVLRELSAGTLDHVLVEGGEGRLVVSSVPGSKGLLILAVRANHEALLGQVLSQTRSCAQSLCAAAPV